MPDLGEVDGKICTCCGDQCNNAYNMDVMTHYNSVCTVPSTAPTNPTTEAPTTTPAAGETTTPSAASRVDVNSLALIAIAAFSLKF